MNMPAMRSTIVRVDHLCCGMEAKLVRDLFSPVSAIGDVKISLADRRVSVEHDPELAPEEIVEMLNKKHLGASLQEKAVVETVGSSFNHAETVRLTVNVTQIVLFVATLALYRLGFPKTALGVGWVCVALSVSLFAFRPAPFVANNPLYAAALLPNLIKELLGLKMQ